MIRILSSWDVQEQASILGEQGRSFTRIDSRLRTRLEPFLRLPVTGKCDRVLTMRLPTLSDQSLMRDRSSVVQT